MMVEKMVSLCKSIRVEECQTQALFVESLFEGLLQPPSLVSRPPHLLRDVPFPVIKPVLVVSLLV